MPSIHQICILPKVVVSFHVTPLQFNSELPTLPCYCASLSSFPHPFFFSIPLDLIHFSCISHMLYLQPLSSAHSHFQWVVAFPNQDHEALPNRMLHPPPLFSTYMTPFHDYIHLTTTLPTWIHPLSTLPFSSTQFSYHSLVSHLFASPRACNSSFTT